MHGPIPGFTENLEEVLRGIRQRTPVRVLTETEPSLRAKSDAGDPLPEHLRGIRKVSSLLGLLGVRYQDVVNERRAAEGKPTDFVAAPRKGCERIDGSPLLQGKDGPLLELIVLECEAVEYRLDGLPVDGSLLEPWLPPSREAGDRQGLDQPVVYRTFKLSGVRDLQFLSVPQPEPAPEPSSC